MVHPNVSARPHVLLTHERLIEHIDKHEDVKWVAMAEICDDFKRRNPYPEVAMKPSPPGEAMSYRR